MPPSSPFSLTRVAFPSKRHPTTSHRDLVRQALQGWGDPEQLTDAEATELKRLCVRWFRLGKATQLQARVWKDAIVFTTHEDPGIEHAIILQGAREDASSQNILLLYRIDRGRRMIPAEHCTLQYLKYVVDQCMEMMMWLKLLPAPVTALIDLDLCTMYGNDYNDLIWIMQLLGHRRPNILAVMRKLMNPAMARAIKRIEALGHNVRVCVYTRKGGLVDQINGSQYKAPNGDLYFPASTHLSEISSTSPSAFQRLFYARQVIGEALGRKDIEMVVTKNKKSVADTCISTLMPPADPARAFLYDDNMDYADAIIVPQFDAIHDTLADPVFSIVGCRYLEATVANKVKNGMDVFYNSLDEGDRLTVYITSKPSLDWPLPSVCGENTVSLRQHRKAATRGYVAVMSWKFW